MPETDSARKTVYQGPKIVFLIIRLFLCRILYFGILGFTAIFGRSGCRKRTQREKRCIRDRKSYLSFFIFVSVVYYRRSRGGGSSRAIFRRRGRDRSSLSANFRHRGRERSSRGVNFCRGVGVEQSIFNGFKINQ